MIPVWLKTQGMRNHNCEVLSVIRRFLSRRQRLDQSFLADCYGHVSAATVWAEGALRPSLVPTWLATDHCPRAPLQPSGNRPSRGHRPSKPLQRHAPPS
jgi:hypothetical protein